MRDDAPEPRREGDDLTASGPSPSAARAGRGWARIFGLDPRAAALTVIVDLMANGATIASLGLLVPLEIAAGAALSFIVYRIQRHWYRDSRESSVIKALSVGLLTAIPVATTPYIVAYAVGGTLLGRSRHRHESTDATDVTPR